MDGSPDKTNDAMMLLGKFCPNISFSLSLLIIVEKQLYILDV